MRAGEKMGVNGKPARKLAFSAGVPRTSSAACCGWDNSLAQAQAFRQINDAKILATPPPPVRLFAAAKSPGAETADHGRLAVGAK